jgi:NAD(P)-dependent dehydrogenase (short-subunit alcohol dehydrogenase family)
VTGGGVILNASSFSAIIPNAGRAPYSACKAAVTSLTRTFAAELAADKIRVIAYVPGLISTEISAKNIEKNGERHTGRDNGREILRAKSVLLLRKLDFDIFHKNNRERSRLFFTVTCI